MSGYQDADGYPVTLDELCRREPAWAANQIRMLQARTLKFSFEVKRPGVYRAIVDLRGEGSLRFERCTDVDAE